jgi:hypothetical protein
MEMARPTPNPFGAVASPDEAAAMVSVASKIEVLFLQLLDDRPFAEVVPKGGIFDYPLLRREGLRVLVNDPAPLLAGPAAVLQDLNGALKALAFDIPTGAAMIALRGTEGIVRHTYERIFAAPSAAKDWFDLAKEITDDQRKKGADPGKVEGYLTYLKKVRNSAQHPGREFSIREAEDALTDAARATVILQALK